MFSKTLRDIARPHWFPILDAVKRSTGLSVPELAVHLKMSYMGVKKHCIALEKLGYLDTWRRPKQVGRPEKLYRLTEKANLLYPQIGDEVTLTLLDAATQTDANAGEKLLFAYFGRQADILSKKIKGTSIADRAASLAKLRDQSGHVSECHYDREIGLHIVEYHNPLQSLFDRYPTLDRMEEQMFERVLNAPVDRNLTKISGLRKLVFQIGTI
jgi:predicted ArsR family transcriptional regulator